MSDSTSNGHDLTPIQTQKDISDIKFQSVDNCQHTDQPQTENKNLSSSTNIQPPNYPSSDIPTYGDCLTAQELQDLSVLPQGTSTANNVSHQTNIMELDDTQIVNNHNTNIQSEFQLIGELENQSQHLHPVSKEPCMDNIGVVSKKEVSHQEEFRFQSVLLFFSDLCFE